jgi:alcohol dehydrogenase
VADRIFQYHAPTQVVFGTGASQRVGRLLHQNGCRRALLVSDRGVEQAGIVERILESIRRSGVEAAMYCGVVENPTVENVQEGCVLLKGEGCGAIVAVGGGSPMDAAKAISVVAAHGGVITDYEMGRKPVLKAGPPVFAVPTTAGTGSEVTFGAVITDQETHRKFDVKSRLMAPLAACVDPELTVTLPPPVTAATGMDALCHAVEAYVTKAANPLTDALALHAVGLIGRHLVEAFFDGSRMDARRGMILASTMAGLAFANSGLGAVHGISAPLGAYCGIAHGVANAVMLPHVMAFNLEACRERYAGIALALGCESAEGEAAVARIRDLSAVLQIPRLSSFGVKADAAAALASEATGPHSNCSQNPRFVGPKEAEMILTDALGG